VPNVRRDRAVVKHAKHLTEPKDMRITIVHNPDGGTGSLSAREIAALAREAGHEVHYQSSKEDGWEQALRRAADLVVAAGGDGTVSKVARRLVGRPVPMTILPLGSANNLASAHELTGMPAERLIAGWAEGRRVRLDAGLARGPWGEKGFVESFGLGLFAEDSGSAGEPPFPLAPDKVTAALQTLAWRLPRAPARACRAALDGQDVSGEYVLLEVLNNRLTGPNLALARAADSGDGLLDVILLAEEQRDALARYLDARLDGRVPDVDFPVRRGRRLEVHWDGPSAQIDDGVWPKSGVASDGASPSPIVAEVQVVPGGLQFLLPRV
jgi:diacylglycerol kinase family enzyme